MTIKDMERLTGMSRANIRFYEDKGLLQPTRQENGYRVYTQQEVDALKRIALLRSLDVSIEELRALSLGTRELSALLRDKLELLQQREQEAARAQRVCRAICEDHAAYATLDAEKYLHDLPAPAAAVREDRLPYPYFPARRYFARMVDAALYHLLWVMALTLLFGAVRGSLFGALDVVIELGLMYLIEPILLHCFGTTLGKWIMGLRVEAAEGGRPTLAAARARTGMVLWRGLGLNLPAWRGFRLWKAYQAWTQGEIASWDSENELLYTYRDRASWRAAALAAAWTALVLASISCVLWARRMPHRGEITVAEFADNYNFVCKLYDQEETLHLNADGTWKTQSPEGVVICVDEEAMPQWQFTCDAQGHVQSVAFQVECEDGEVIYHLKRTALKAAIAYLSAQRGAGLWSDARVARLMREKEALSTLAFDFAGVHVQSEVDCPGYAEIGGMLWPVEDAARAKVGFWMEK